jgi:hypothetical protein
MALNLAVTKDGDSYNKLRRPDDYLMSTSRNASPLTTASSPTIHIGKRKSEQDMMSVNKRPKTGRERSRNPESAWDTGMKTVLPGLYGEDQSTDESMSEAIAYLQSVRYVLAATRILLQQWSICVTCSLPFNLGLKQQRFLPCLWLRRTSLTMATRRVI